MLRKIVSKTLKRKSSKPERLEFGCGAQKTKSGFVGVDIRKFPHVKYVCNSWEILNFVQPNSILEIYSRHFLEHLTFPQAEMTLRAWNKILAPGGKVHVIVPDMEYHIEQFLDERADGKSEANPNWSLKEHAIAGFWGWQREADSQLWDVHKSGYTFAMLKQKLLEHGFTQVERIEDKPWHLNVVCQKQDDSDRAFLEQEAQKAKGGGERQASPDISKVRADHRKRYEFAAQSISSSDRVLDLACGVGYGSYILATQTNCHAILSIDVSQEAIDYARKYYSNPNITYTQGDCFKVPIERHSFDVCVSFETVEHISEDLKLLNRFHDALKPEGRLILSTPNQREMPFSPEKFPFHCRHYLPEELESLVNRAGFTIEQVVSQKDKKTGELTPGWEGKFNILLCKKV